MKILILNICLLFISINATIGQHAGTLYLDGNKLKGKCENQYFTGFEVELDTTYSTIDSSVLFGQLPRIGSINFKNRVDIPTEFTITDRAGFSQIMFRFRTTYLTFDSLKIQGKSISFTIDDNPQVPVTENDLKIIRLAKKLLSEEKYWNRQDDRQCIDDLANKTFRLKTLLSGLLLTQVAYVVPKYGMSILQTSRRRFFQNQNLGTTYATWVNPIGNAKRQPLKAYNEWIPCPCNVSKSSQGLRFFLDLINNLQSIIFKFSNRRAVHICTIENAHSSAEIFF